MTIGLVGRKAGMTRVFTDAGDSLPVTVIEALPNRIVQVKDSKADGYRAVQVTFGTRRASRLTSRSHPVTPSRACCRARSSSSSASPKARRGPETGAELKVDLFKEGQIVDIAGATIGKGYAGVMKRHGFAGGMASHGASGRAPRARLDRPAPDAGPRVPGQAHVRPYGR